MASSSIDAASGITEQSERAKQEFFAKVAKLRAGTSTTGTDKLLQDIFNQAAGDYNRLFGRIGTHPLMSFNNGKRLPRYILDRDEVWVIYKPVLWQMGGAPPGWTQTVEAAVEKTKKKNKEDVMDQLLRSSKIEQIQVFHGLSHGFGWIDVNNPPMGWGFVQRLDAETDGPVIVAKTWRAQRALQAQMKEHIFGKAYLCLVHGRVENRIHSVKCKFAELGSDASTQVMLKHDKENDPFFDWATTGKIRNRTIKMAESFVKPMAYYDHADGSRYTLMYVNILSGITHQIRITMQSLGHPLVSDDRYLPKDIANKDLTWCPRNFLTETRSDWFDVCGPYKDVERRKYERISIENPLPKLLQQVLENRLKLVEKLDPTADLYVGCQYWALGEEQLMYAYPKDDEYRKKLIRWGMRHGIHLDALDRLLCLPKEDIETLLNEYKPYFEKDEETWLCPICMELVIPSKRPNQPNVCPGAMGKDCKGQKIVDFDSDQKPPKGWCNWLADPTMHFLCHVNIKWLEARRKILKQPRPPWEKPPAEFEGSPATAERLRILDSALRTRAKQGQLCGIGEDELNQVPGLEDIVLPLGPPPEDSTVQRVRLPGRGTQSRWTYTLKGKERIQFTEDFQVKRMKLRSTPINVPTHNLPEKQIRSKEEKKKREEELEKRLAEAEARDEERTREEALKEKQRQDAEKEKAKEPRASNETVWRMVESKSNPGNYFYFNDSTGESSTERPVGFDRAKPIWEKKESKSNLGEHYFYNSETGESRAEKPLGVDILNDTRSEDNGESAEKRLWSRVESESKPGHFYYHNSITGENEINPPRVILPWKLTQSASRKTQFYYYNEQTRESTEHPPQNATAASKGKAAKRPTSSELAPEAKRPAQGRLPPDWIKKDSSSQQGKAYYTNTVTGETRWKRPVWEKKPSKSQPGAFYYQHVDTGDVSWKRPEGA